MDRTKRLGSRTRHRLAAGLALPALVALSACGKSTNNSTGSSSTTPPATSPAPSPAASSSADAAFTISSAAVTGLGTVLVNGDGQTLYVLSSESGKKVTCTSANSCTPVWPPVSLPSGMSAAIAGGSAQTSMLSTVTAPDGTRVTYAGYPLYTFSYDGGPMSDKGEDVSSFGGTWYAMAPDGTPVTAKTTSASPASSPSASPSPTAASGGGGYGY